MALFRIVDPSAGSILVDGVDISSFAKQTLRSRITAIPQDPVLFRATLRYNLDPFDTYTDKEVWDALKHASLDGMANRLTLQGKVYRLLLGSTLVPFMAPITSLPTN